MKVIKLILILTSIIGMNFNSNSQGLSLSDLETVINKINLDDYEVFLSQKGYYFSYVKRLENITGKVFKFDDEHYIEVYNGNIHELVVFIFRNPKYIIDFKEELKVNNYLKIENYNNNVDGYIEQYKKSIFNLSFGYPEEEGNLINIWFEKQVYFD